MKSKIGSKTESKREQDTTGCLLLRRTGMTAVILLMGTVWGASALAQPPDGPPPGQGRGGPGGPGGPPNGRPPFGGPQTLSPANAPVAALEAGLKLSADQKTKITAIQRQYQQQRRDLMPPPPGSQEGGPPDPETMRASRDKMRALDQKTSDQITALLTSEQKQTLPTLLKEIDSLRSVGIPPELYGSLKLTGDQKQKLLAIVRKAQQEMRTNMDKARESGDFQSIRDTMMKSQRQTHEQAMVVLTAEQRAAAEKFRKEHPQRGPGGPGGPGGPPPPGGPGGPPDGGPDGPPPGGDGPPPPPPGGDGPPESA